jgi:hypothetical protein
MSLLEVGTNALCANISFLENYTQVREKFRFENVTNPDCVSSAPMGPSEIRIWILDFRSIFSLNPTIQIQLSGRLLLYKKKKILEIIFVNFESRRKGVRRIN